MPTSDVRRVTCTTCPVGCRVEVTMEGAQPVRVAGNRCKRGDVYARAEVTDPRRVVTSTIWALSPDGTRSLMPVRTRTAVPKRLMFDIMRRLAGMEVSLPIRMGDIIERDILGTGVDLVSSRALPPE